MTTSIKQTELRLAGETMTLFYSVIPASRGDFYTPATQKEIRIEGLEFKGTDLDFLIPFIDVDFQHIKESILEQEQELIW